jgi:hypothetical protein
MRRLSQIQPHGRSGSPIPANPSHPLQVKSGRVAPDRAKTADWFVQVFDLIYIFADDFFDFLTKHRIHAVCGPIPQTYPHLYPPFL